MDGAVESAFACPTPGCAGTSLGIDAVTTRPKPCLVCVRHGESEQFAIEREARRRNFVGSVPRIHEWAARCEPNRFDLECSEVAPQISARDRAAVFDVPASAPMLLLTGPAGAGKSTLAVAFGARRTVQAPVIFVSAIELAHDFCSRRLGEPCRLLEHAKAATVAIVDDLGKDLRYGPIGSTAAIDLIFARHMHDRQTVVTTGLRSDEIARGYDDDGMLRRLTEKGRAIVLRLGGKDARDV